MFTVKDLYEKYYKGRNQMGHGVGKIPGGEPCLLSWTMLLKSRYVSVEWVLLLSEISVAVEKGSQNDAGIGCLASVALIDCDELVYNNKVKKTTRLN